MGDRQIAEKDVKQQTAATDNLKQLAREARRQIDNREHDSTFRAEGIDGIEKIGLAYRKSAVEICQLPS